MAELDTIACPHCGAPLPPSAAREVTVCPFCGASAQPAPRVIEREVERVVVKDGPALRAAGTLCPRCADPLRKTTVGSHTLRGCDRCGGLWLHKDVVEYLRQNNDTALCTAARRMIGIVMVRVDCKPRIGCPFCAKPMDRTELTDTIHYIDSCAEHGTWFDHNELPEFVRVFTDRRAGEVTSEDLEAAGVPGGGGGGFFTDLFRSLQR